MDLLQIIHIVNTTMFQCGNVNQLWHVSLTALRPIHDNPLAYQSGAFSLDFTSEYQFNYFFSKNVLFNSNICKF